MLRTHWIQSFITRNRVFISIALFFIILYVTRNLVFISIALFVIILYITRNRVFIRIALFVIILYITHFLVATAKYNQYDGTINGKHTNVTSNASTNSSDVSSSIVSIPSIWMIGLLNLNTSISRCDYYKTSLSRQMFWNEHLFQQLLWIIDDNPDFVRIVESNYRSEWPFPNFLIASISSSLINSMERIHAHTHFRSPQYELQQWVTFYLDTYADNYAKMNGLESPRILAIVDADAQLQTLATFESIFPEFDHSTAVSKQRLKMRLVDSDFKLKAHGIDMGKYSEATRLFLNRSQVANFMLTFPVYLYKTTLVNLRQYVSELHNKTFDAAFEAIMTTSPTYYSQFAIILSYAYWFERDRYSFHIQPVINTLVEHPITKSSVQHSIVSKPPVRVMLHTKSGLLGPIQKGCCFSYELNQPEMIDGEEFTDDVKQNISRICNSFGSVESHYEMVCEDPLTSNLEQRMFWRRNDTITEHYGRVKEALKRLSKESIRKKKNACSKFLGSAKPETWFPNGGNCTFPS